jgi:hypothetical protein
MNTNVKSINISNILKNILTAVMILTACAVIYSASVVVYILIVGEPCPWSISLSEVGNVF